MARLIETPRSHLSALLNGSKGIGDTLAAKIEAVFDKPPGWLDRDPANLYAAPPIDLNEPRVNYGQESPVAHAVIDRQPIVSPTTILWEQLSVDSISGQFLMAVQGDALMPTYPPGQMAIWQACNSSAVQPGQAALIQLADGRYELRFFERRAKGWAGVSERRGHGELLPDRDGAQVVARLRYPDLG